jgi:hypothetical protein
MLPFAFVALAWYLLRTRTLPRGWLGALLAFLGFANGLAPWAVHTAMLYGEPTPVVDSVYLHLWIGNNPQATGGPLSEDALPPRLAARMREVPSDRQPQRYGLLAREAAEEWRRNPEASLRRRAWAALAFWTGERFLTDPEHRLTETVPGVGPEWLSMAPTVLLGWLLAVAALALLGWRWTYAWRRESMPAMLAVVLAPLPYVLGHAEALHGARLPLDGILICYAAFALLCLLPGVRQPLLDGPQASAPE